MQQQAVDSLTEALLGFVALILAPRLLAGQRRSCVCPAVLAVLPAAHRRAVCWPEAPAAGADTARSSQGCRKAGQEHSSAAVHCLLHTSRCQASRKGGAAAAATAWLSSCRHACFCRCFNDCSTCQCSAGGLLRSALSVSILFLCCCCCCRRSAINSRLAAATNVLRQDRTCLLPACLACSIWP